MIKFAVLIYGLLLNRYGWLGHIRLTPQLPNQVYRFDPDTGSVRVVADQFVRNNGIAFNADGSEVFV
jgi:gluconolactonase